jgi:hypothetical protein
MYDITGPQFIMILIFIGLLLLFSPCHVSAFKAGGRIPLKGGLSKGQRCSQETTPCKRGLVCLSEVCTDVKTKEDDMFK